MILTIDYPGIALVLTGLSTVIGALGGIVIGIRNSRKIDDVHREVKTGNDVTMGALVGEQEARRVAGIPPHERTEDEKHRLQHLGFRMMQQSIQQEKREAAEMPDRP